MRCLLVHGAGGGAWEFEQIWVPVLQVKCPSLSDVQAITLVPRSEEDGGLEATTFDDYVRQVVYQTRACASEHEPVVLIGASMGGMIVLAAAASILQNDENASTVSIAGIVLVCSCVPKQVKEQLQSSPSPSPSAPYPPRVLWAASPTSFEDTRACLPDACSEVVAFAASSWRDESGCVLSELAQGISLPFPFPLQCSSTRYLCVIPMKDESVPPLHQQKLASMLSASIMELPDMLHIEPLLGSKSEAIAEMVAAWIASVSANN